MLRGVVMNLIPLAIRRNIKKLIQTRLRNKIIEDRSTKGRTREPHVKHNSSSEQQASLLFTGVIIFIAYYCYNIHYTFIIY